MAVNFDPKIGINHVFGKRFTWRKPNEGLWIRISSAQFGGDNATLPSVIRVACLSSTAIRTLPHPYGCPNYSFSNPFSESSHSFELMISTTAIQTCQLLLLHISHSRDHDLQAGFKLAPPTKKPSISLCLARSLQFFSLTEPP